MNRTEALNLLYSHIKNPRTIAHCLASEAVLRALAARLNQDVELWGLADLLHDLDVEQTVDKPQMHGHETVKILAEKGFEPEVLEAILKHNEMNNSGERSTVFQHALSAGETITGLITATALVYPDKKVVSVKPKSVTKRMKEKAFAASVNRDAIMECEKLGLSLDEFAALSIEAMASIADEIGL